SVPFVLSYRPPFPLARWQDRCSFFRLMSGISFHDSDDEPTAGMPDFRIVWGTEALTGLICGRIARVYSHITGRRPCCVKQNPARLRCNIGAKGRGPYEIEIRCWCNCCYRSPGSAGSASDRSEQSDQEGHRCL